MLFHKHKLVRVPQHAPHAAHALCAGQFGEGGEIVVLNRSGDAREPGGGDLLLQICATSPTTVAHAQRRLLAGAAGLASVRWVQRGFREPHEGPGVPMRNLFGQVDGTVQPVVAGLDADLLWSADAGPTWLRGGSSVVVRRIEMDLDGWDRVDRLSRENSIGRRLATGAPVTGGGLDTAPDLEAVDGLGFHVVDDAAHSAWQVRV